MQRRRPDGRRLESRLQPSAGVVVMSVDEVTSRWFELAVSCDPDAVEMFTAFFLEIGCGAGVVIAEPVSPGANDGDVVVDPLLPVTVSTYLPAETAEPIIDHVRESLPLLRQEYEVSDLVVRGVVVTKRADEDWADAWQSHGNLLHVGRRVLVKAPWLDHDPEPGEIVLELETGLAFGTGGHPSTHLVMTAIEDTVAPGMRVLDVGTGTGILAIASAILGAAAVDAVDIEPEAVRVARANAVHNGVGNRVRVARGSVGAGQPFQDEYDLVVANILGPILITLADDLTRAVRRGGGLILGGIIDFREVSVRDAFQALGMQITRREELDGWVMLVLRKPDPGSAPANS
ncbi:MAG: 50S ribosomal protein L11 methyltransferase [Chloroflexia bacterium]|nr:50S ribosomal protein L11 methyltransferase [Chloroflexia bacterium]